jgi:hypothetical protein
MEGKADIAGAMVKAMNMVKEAMMKSGKISSDDREKIKELEALRDELITKIALYCSDNHKTHLVDQVVNAVDMAVMLIIREDL